MSRDTNQRDPSLKHCLRDKSSPEKSGCKSTACGLKMSAQSEFMLPLISRRYSWKVAHKITSERTKAPSSTTGYFKNRGKGSATDTGQQRQRRGIQTFVGPYVHPPMGLAPCPGGTTEPLRVALRLRYKKNKKQKQHKNLVT